MAAACAAGPRAAALLALLSTWAAAQDPPPETLEPAATPAPPAPTATPPDRLDECTIHGTVCTAKNQVCTDLNQDPTHTDDWMCSCFLPATGKDMLGEPALCTKDECVTAPSNGAETCLKADQACMDLDTNEVSTGDWYCMCTPPTNGTANRAVAVCILDECVAKCATCAWGNCTGGAYPQTCHDPNTSPGSVGDWYCECDLPTEGRGKRAAAVCELDECANLEGCWTCANATCSAAGQHCVDLYRSPDAVMDWECQCTRPLTGQAIQLEPAECFLDECTAVCDTCAMGACGNQSCEDVDEDPGSTGDWMCVCVAPQNGTAALKPAVCSLVECGGQCDHCERGVCGSAESAQTCVEGSIAVEAVRDWMCVCDAPAVGSMRLAAATCELDECCLACAGGEACGMAMQACTDPDKSLDATGDFVCVCRPPYEGSGIGEAAECTLPGNNTATTPTQTDPTTAPGTSAPGTTGAPANATATAAPSDEGATEDDDGAPFAPPKTGFILLLVAGLQCLLIVVVCLWCRVCRSRDAKKGGIPLREPPVGEPEPPAPKDTTRGQTDAIDLGAANAFATAPVNSDGEGATSIRAAPAASPIPPPDAASVSEESQLMSQVNSLQGALATLVGKLEGKGLRTDDLGFVTNGDFESGTGYTEMTDMPRTHSSPPPNSGSGVVAVPPSPRSSTAYVPGSASMGSIIGTPAAVAAAHPSGTSSPAAIYTLGGRFNPPHKGLFGSGRGGKAMADPTSGAPRQGVPSSAASPRANQLFAPRGMGAVFTSPYSSPKTIGPAQSPKARVQGV